MGIVKAKSLPARRAQRPEELLETYYGQLLQWGTLITRGDEVMARDIVHDLCLHFTLAQPDLNHVENLDGYLYTSLRHLYLSALDKASREATRLLSVAEYDSIHFAPRSGSPELLLQRQNDIRRICSYAIWRKETSKSASYLTLLFFHGYSRSEIAALACAPLAAIYNKLKIARQELKAHLAQSNSLSIARGDNPPVPALRVTPVPFAELFDELRTTILGARSTDCLAADSLLAHYPSTGPKPISCSLLSHIVSCERCLTLLDRHLQRPTSSDREPPLDSMGGSDFKRGSNASGGDYRLFMRSVRWRRDRVYEHRPQALSITVNGKITAFHDVQSERSTLCSRIENPESAQFVEVFSDQQIRLAMLPVGERPPTGQHSQTQRIALSDDRWLELTLRFDGLGLHSEVTYVDPTLAATTVSDDAEELPLPAASTEFAETIWFSPATTHNSWHTRVLEALRRMLGQRGLAWSAMVVIAAIAGTVAYRQLAWHWNPDELLAKSKQVESADLDGFVEHRVLDLQAAAADGIPVLKGTIDLWQGRNGRHLRRLYDSSKHLLAEDWQTRDGHQGSVITPDADHLPAEARALIGLGVWRQDVSAGAFEAIAPHQLTMHRTANNYEITTTASNGLHFASATLVLDRRLHAIGEILRIQSGNSVSTVRLVEAAYERRPLASVPDSAFEPSDLGSRSEFQPQSPSSAQPFAQSNPFGSDVRTAELEVAVLAQLNRIGADVGEPLKVERTANEHIRVDGVVEDADRRRQIVTALEAIPDRRLLDVLVVSQLDIKVPHGLSKLRTSHATSVYTVENSQSPADALIRNHLSREGLSSDRISALAAQFTRDTLGHAQHALQEAYALDRLGSSFSSTELREMDAASDHQWAQMAAWHASVLNRELRALHDQLVQLTPVETQDSTTHNVSRMIQHPDEFAHTVHSMLQEVQLLNKRTALAFTSGSVTAHGSDAATLVREAAQSIPIRDADTVVEFASRLAASGDDAVHASAKE
jgi:DNA-directed RNA polymerase specialized sigma24 family protein